MPHVKLSPTQTQFIEIDDGVVIGPGSIVNVDTTRPLAAAAISANKLVAVDSNTAPGTLASKDAIIHRVNSEADAVGKLGPGQFTFWFDPTNGAAVVHPVGKTLNGTIVRGTNISLT